METYTANVSIYGGRVIQELERFVVSEDAGRERIANRLRQLWQGLQRFEDALSDSELSANPPELDLALTELSPRRLELIRELSRIEASVRDRGRTGLVECRRQLERAVGLVNAYEAEVSDLFLRAFWLDLGVGD